MAKKTRIERAKKIATCRARAMRINPMRLGTKREDALFMAHCRVAKIGVRARQVRFAQVIHATLVGGVR